MDNKTEFKIKFGDTEKTVIVTKPNDVQETEADIYSSQIFAKMAKARDDDGKPSYMVRAKLDEFLRDTGIYTDEDFEKLGNIGKEIGELEDKMYAGQISKKEGRAIAIQLRTLRYELLLLLNRKAAYDVHTIEHYCQDARMDFLITQCITFENNEPVYKTVNDYKTDDTIKTELKPCIEELASMISTFDPEYEKKLPENKFLLKFNYCDEELNLTDPEDGHLVDTDGNRINKDGERVDDEGNVLDVNGDHIERELGEFFDDPEDKVEDTKTEDKPVKRTRKKKPVKV